MKLSEDLKTRRVKYEFFDGFVLAMVLILSAIGVLMVFSITGTTIFNNESEDNLSYMLHSATGVVLGVITMAAFAIAPNKLFRGKWGLLILLGTVVIFIITPIFGQGTRASPYAYRWLAIPGLPVFQAVDLARIGFTLSLPLMIQWLVDTGLYYSKKIWSAYWIPIFYVLLCAGLIILQPDLGSAIVIFITGMVIVFSSGIHVKQIIFLSSIAAIAVVVVSVIGIYAIDLQYYQMQRINAWRDPFNHPRGHQSVMGFMSIALGSWTGLGLGESKQALGFAIEPHTDLIVTILSEELGLIAVFIVMLLYFFIAFKCFTTAFKARDVFSALVCIGVGSFFLAQTFVNLGGASGFIPLSGVTLPLISYGMTSKISTFALIGIYFNMRRHILIDVEKSKARREKKKEGIEENNILKFLSQLEGRNQRSDS